MSRSQSPAQSQDPRVCGPSNDLSRSMARERLGDDCMAAEGAMPIRILSHAADKRGLKGGLDESRSLRPLPATTRMIIRWLPPARIPGRFRPSWSRSPCRRRPRLRWQSETIRAAMTNSKIALLRYIRIARDGRESASTQSAGVELERVNKTAPLAARCGEPVRRRTFFHRSQYHHLWHSRVVLALLAGQLEREPWRSQ
jgi:hypothetical protein